MKKNNKTNYLSDSFSVVSSYVRKNIAKLIVFIVTFICSLLLSFLHTATSDTVSTYSLAEYEIGQIADRDVVARKSIPADFENEISITKGEKVIKKGFPITEFEYAKLKRMAEAPAYIDYRLFADTVLFMMLLSAMFFFLFGTTCLGYPLPLKDQITGSVFFVLTYGSALFVASKGPFQSSMLIALSTPAIFFVFLVAILFGQRNAVYFSIVISFGVLNAAGGQLLPFLYILASSLAASRIVRRINRRIDMLVASFVQSALNCVFLIVLKIAFNSPLGDMFALLPGVAFNGFFSGILCLGFLTPIELLLNTSSVFRLMDLNDLSTPTMKKLLVNASGTYTHSMMVAQLAEAACNEIGANGLLARVGAYYHDIGKMDNPEYFTENQTGTNIHTEINPSLSVSIIRSHVKKGVETAMALHMPDRIIDIIREHHGNQVISFFYNAAKEKDPNVNPEDYSYTGTPPSSKESAVVMLADTVEAACRSLTKPSVSRIEKFVQELVDSKIANNQLNNCGITFKDLKLVKDAFVQILAGYYHSRIKYPDQKDPDTGLPDNASAAGVQKTPDAAPSKEEEKDEKAEVEKASESTPEKKEPSPKNSKASSKEKSDEPGEKETKKGKNSKSGEKSSKSAKSDEKDKTYA